MPGRDRALSDERGAVSPVCPVLEKTVPMLQSTTLSVHVQVGETQASAYNGRGLQHVFVGELVDHIDLEIVSLEDRVISKENPLNELSYNILCCL